MSEELSEPFSAVLFGFVGVLLLSGSGLLVSYAVNRDDYLHEVLVLIAFVPFILGFLMIFYASGAIILGGWILDALG